MGLVADTARFLARIRRKLRVKKLHLIYIAGGMDDPSRAAITHGALAGVIGVSTNVLESAFNVREYSIYTDVNFLEDKPQISGEVAVSIAIWEIMAIGCGALRIFLKNRKKSD